MPSAGIIIPCYNEYKRLNTREFCKFLEENNDFTFYFVNDGSTDKSEILLKEIRDKVPKRVKIISLPENIGKGGAIREGLLAALQDTLDFAGYFDADLSTPLPELKKMYCFIQKHQFDFILGSRIKKIDTQIFRSSFRHLTGRLIATIIDERFKIGCYDTQCGAKLFKTTIIQPVITEPFFTTWFFDVEILLRLRSLNGKVKIFEYPLSSWQHVQGSKLNIFSIPKVLIDMKKLITNYKK